MLVSVPGDDNSLKYSNDNHQLMYIYQYCPIKDIHGCILIFISELMVEYHYTSPHQDYIPIHDKLESHKNSAVFSAYTSKYYELNTTTKALP